MSTTTASPGFWQTARRAVSRRRAADFLKTMVVVIPLTLLIWIYAERSQVTEGQQQMTIEFEPADPALAATIPAGENASLTLDLKGPLNQISQFKDEIVKRASSAAGRIKVTLPANYAEKGDTTVELRTLLNSDPAFNSFGVDITKVTPAIIRVQIDTYDEQPLTVAMPPDLPPSVQNVAFTPPTVMARGPAAVMEREFPKVDGVRTIRVDASNQPLLSQPGEHLRVEMPLVLPRDGRFVIRPSRVMARFDVSPATEETTIDSVTIAVQMPLGMQGKWLVKVHNQLRVQNVKFRGPKVELAQFRATTGPNGEPQDPKKLATAVLRVQQEDIGKPSVTRRVDFVDLGPGMTPVGGPYEVEFHLEQAPG